MENLSVLIPLIFIPVLGLVFMGSKNNLDIFIKFTLVLILFIACIQIGVNYATIKINQHYYQMIKDNNISSVKTTYKYKKWLLDKQYKKGE